MKDEYIQLDNNMDKLSSLKTGVKKNILTKSKDYTPDKDVIKTVGSPSGIPEEAKPNTREVTIKITENLKKKLDKR